MTVATELVEAAAAATLSSDETVVIDGWRVSTNGGFTRRLNSATALGHAETSLEAKRAVMNWLADHRAPLVVRVTPLMDPRTAEACERNWYLEKRDETRVLTRVIDEAEFPADVQKIDPLDRAFVDEFFALNDRRPYDDAVWVRMVERISPNATGLWIPGAGVGYVASYGPLSFVYSVAVKPLMRRAGIGTSLMEAAAAWAYRRGAVTMILQVLGTNEPGLRLYDTLGCSEVYRYHYLQGPWSAQRYTAEEQCERRR